jgi:hypothetical protein
MHFQTPGAYCLPRSPGLRLPSLPVEHSPHCLPCVLFPVPDSSFIALVPLRVICQTGAGASEQKNSPESYCPPPPTHTPEGEARIEDQPLACFPLDPPGPGRAPPCPQHFCNCPGSCALGLPPGDSVEPPSAPGAVSTGHPRVLTPT